MTGTWYTPAPVLEALGLTTYEPAAGTGGFLVKIHNSTTATGWCCADDDRRAETPEPHEDCPVSCPGPLGHRPPTPDQP